MNYIIRDIEVFAHDVKIMALNMAKDAGREGSHIGGSFSCLEILSTLYGGILQFDHDDPSSENRDVFIPSKTHCILTHFACLAEKGFIKKEDIFSFHHNGGLLCGHPWNNHIGLEFAGGSLGMGLSVGIGQALYLKRKAIYNKVYVLLGDGESNEGSVWEAILSASKFKLDNLVAVFDYNNMQFDGPNDEIMSVAPLSEKLRAFGWDAVDVDGHSISELYYAFQREHEGRPMAIIAHTIKAHGIPSLENTAKSHHSAISEEDYEYAMNQALTIDRKDDNDR